MHKKDIGNYGEFLVITECLKNGVSVFKDVGDNSKFDLVIADSKNNLFKVQVKNYCRTGNKTVVYFYKSGPNYKFSYTTDQVDYFAVVDQETNKIAWIKFADFCDKNKRSIILRHKKALSNNGKDIKMFDDFIKFPFY